MPLAPGSYLGDVGSLLRLIQEEKAGQLANIPPRAEPSTPIREAIQEPVAAAESPGTSRIVGVKPEGVIGTEAAPVTPAEGAGMIPQMARIGPPAIGGPGEGIGAINPASMFMTGPQPGGPAPSAPGAPGAPSAPAPARSPQPAVSIGTKIMPSSPSAPRPAASVTPAQREEIDRITNAPVQTSQNVLQKTTEYRDLLKTQLSNLEKTFASLPPEVQKWASSTPTPTPTPAPKAPSKPAPPPPAQKAPSLGQKIVSTLSNFISGLFKRR